MKKLLSKRATTLFCMGALFLTTGFLQAGGGTCHCTNFLGIFEICNNACGDGVLENGEAKDGSGWNWLLW